MSHPFGGVSARDRLGARLHLHERVGILRQSWGDDPFGQGRVARSPEARAAHGANWHTAFYQKGEPQREPREAPTAGSIESDRFP